MLIHSIPNPIADPDEKGDKVHIFPEEHGSSADREYISDNKLHRMCVFRRVTDRGLVLVVFLMNPLVNLRLVHESVERVGPYVLGHHGEHQLAEDLGGGRVVLAQGRGD